jgi:hypothetical protein
MPGPVLHVNAGVTCTHAGPVTAVSSNTRVLVNGMPAVTIADTFTVAGCPFQVPAPSGTKPQPCVRIQWTVPAARVQVNAQPVLVQTSTGVCLSVEQIPQGPPIVAAVQPRVIAT